MAMTQQERKALAGLAVLYASRMLGLFMVLPVLTLYGLELSGANAATLGFALGVYGITQAILQIPFGAASDRYGRKPLITVGLVIFLLGSLLAAMADNVYMLIVARALQGSGAISSVVLALLADYTREEQRSKAMAVIGAVIGSSFVLAVMLGPVIAGIGGLSGLFWFTSLLALLGLLVLWWLPEVPPLQVHEERKVRGELFSSVLRNPDVSVLSLGVFMLHMTMTGLFVALPVILVERGFEAESLGAVYAPVMILAFVLMAPLMMMSERRKAHLRFLRLAGVMMIAALVLVAYFHNGAATAAALLLFFIGFNFIEASLPSLLSRKVDPALRGTAMGVFSTSQFTGAAAGGSLGGLLFTQGGISAIVICAVVAQLIWLAALWFIKPLKTEDRQVQEA